MIGGTSSRYGFVTSTNEAFRASVVWEQPDGTPVDLTGYTADMQARRSENDDTVAFDATTDNGRLTIDPVDGRVNINIPLAVMQAVEPGVYAFDLRAIDSGGTPTRLLGGSIRVDRGVTR